MNTNALRCGFPRGAFLLPGLVFLACTISAFAQEVPTQVLPSITVEHVRDAERMPYANFLTGMDAFQSGHSLAPDATLRFTVVPRQPDVEPSTIELRLVALKYPDLAPIDIPVDRDGNFEVPRVAAMIGKDAEIRASLPAGSLHWRPLVETPGIPADTRRMGDLRLECEVKEAGGLNQPDIPFLGRLFGSPGIAQCTSSSQQVFLAPTALSRVSLDQDPHQAPLDHDRLGESQSLYAVFEPYLRPRAYSPPLQDASISNDALVHFAYREPHAADAGH